MWGGVWMHMFFSQAPFLAEFIMFLHCSLRFSGMFLSLHSCQSRNIEGCRATDELHQLPGCMASACGAVVYPVSFPILKQHQLQHVSPMFHLGGSCHNLLRGIGSWLALGHSRLAPQLISTVRLHLQSRILSCPGVMSTIHGWSPWSRKPCKDIWMSLACRRRG